MIREEAWPFHRTISGVRLCWELEEPKGPKGQALMRRGTLLITRRSPPEDHRRALDRPTVGS